MSGACRSQKNQTRVLPGHRSLVLEQKTTAEDQNQVARVLALIKNPNQVRAKQKFVAAAGYAHAKILPWE
jgi:hypothetical protein